MSAHLICMHHRHDGAKPNSYLISCIETKAALLPLVSALLYFRAFSCGDPGMSHPYQWPLCGGWWGDKMARTHIPFQIFCCLISTGWPDKWLKVLTDYFNACTPTESNHTNSNHLSISFKQAFNLKCFSSSKSKTSQVIMMGVWYACTA